MASLIGKGRKPKFELHLKIYDLNNVPLANGSSFIKWHLLHSMHAEHRGRTPKSPILNHRVDYNFTKHIPSIRISTDKNNHLTECPIEFEILQEFGQAERVTLGFVRLNLSEYVEESEAFVKDVNSPLPKRRTSNSTHSTASTNMDAYLDRNVEDGVVRRYLMQDSKVNCTLRVGVLMVQIDGDRNFVAPALRTAPVFGGIAGLVPPEQMEDDMNKLPSIAKPRDSSSELQDLYRRTLAASWFSQPSEPPANECIEDIFAGGNGWKTKHNSQNQESDSEGPNHGTLRPSDFHRMAQNMRPGSSHRRTNSGSSDKSINTVKGRNRMGPVFTTRQSHPNREETNSVSPKGRDRDDENSRGRSDSFESLIPAFGSDSSVTEGRKRLKEIREADVRGDMVAWSLPGSGLIT